MSFCQQREWFSTSKWNDFLVAYRLNVWAAKRGVFWTAKTRLHGGFVWIFWRLVLTSLKRMWKKGLNLQGVHLMHYLLILSFDPHMSFDLHMRLSYSENKFWRGFVIRYLGLSWSVRWLAWLRKSDMDWYLKGIRIESNIVKQYGQFAMKLRSEGSSSIHVVQNRNWRLWRPELIFMSYSPFSIAHCHAIFYLMNACWSFIPNDKCRSRICLLEGGLILLLT